MTGKLGDIPLPEARRLTAQTEAAAVNFSMASNEIAAIFPQNRQLARLLSSVPFKLLAMPGASPL